MNIPLDTAPRGIKPYTPAHKPAPNRPFDYDSDAAVIRAALPGLLDDPLYRASSCRPRQTIDLASIPDRQLYNAVPTVLRWSRKAQASRKADMLHQLDRLELVHGHLVVAVVHLPFTGSIYDPATTKWAARLARLVVALEFSAVWKLEQARDGTLHLHITTAREALREVPGLPLSDVREVYDLEGHADYMAKAGDARICRADHDRHPHPADIVAAVLEYIHAKSSGSLDAQDWEKAPCLSGYLPGELERRAVETGDLPRPKARLKPRRKPSA